MMRTIIKTSSVCSRLVLVSLMKSLPSYHEHSDLVERQVNEEQSTNAISLWVYDSIIAHQGPLKSSDPFYKGSLYNVLVCWINRGETYEPLYEMIKDDPIFVAKYAKEQGLLDTPE
jgi:hypothetical protein